MPNPTEIHKDLENIVHLRGLIKFADETNTKDILHQAIGYSNNMHHIIDYKKKEDPNFDRVYLARDIYISLLNNYTTRNKDFMQEILKEC